MIYSIKSIKGRRIWHNLRYCVCSGCCTGPAAPTDHICTPRLAEPREWGWSAARPPSPLTPLLHNSSLRQYYFEKMMTYVYCILYTYFSILSSIILCIQYCKWVNGLILRIVLWKNIVTVNRFRNMSVHGYLCRKGRIKKSEICWFLPIFSIHIVGGGGWEVRLQKWEYIFYLFDLSAG